METFVSQGKLFQVELPENWHRDFDENVYTFQQEEGSALQISAMFHPGGKEFVLQKELEKKQKEHPTAHITELSEYGAIHYGLELINEKMLQYVWITGWKSVVLICTLTIESELGNQKIDESYTEIVEILDTLKISPPVLS